MLMTITFLTSIFLIQKSHLMEHGLHHHLLNKHFFVDVTHDFKQFTHMSLKGQNFMGLIV